MLKRISDAIFKRSDDRKLSLLFKKHRVRFDQFIDYLDLNTELPTLHIIKQNNVHKYREANNFDIFVETGTYLGDMVEAQRKHFKKVYSIELGEDLHIKAVDRFKAYSNVKIIQGDSGVMLKTLLNEIDASALFWLDGHYSSGITAKADKNTPILNELEIILDSKIYHGILIDDARLFIGKDDYPSIDELCTFVKSKDPSRIITVSDDIIKIFR